MSSPSRFNLDDLGLNVDNEEDNDFCRGYGANTNLYDDEAYFGVNQAEEEEDETNDQAPEMPTDFYKNVDSFLNKPPPSLKGSSAPIKKSKSDKEREPSNKVPMFPSINAKQQENRMYLPPPPAAAESENIPKKKKTKSKESKSSSEPTGRRPLDNALLSEAFAYTDKLLRDAVIEEQQLQQQQQQQQTQFNSKVSSAPRATSTGTIGLEYGKPQQKSDSSSNVNVLRKLKSDRQKGYLGASTSGKTSATGTTTVAKATDFNVASGEGDFVDTRRNTVDFDELVANFESGATLQKLRKELEESKRSMANSQNYLRNMAKDMMYK